MKHLSSFLRGSLPAALLLLLWLAGPAARAQAPAWQVATALCQCQTTSASYLSISATATDGTGNLYLAGIFQGTISLGNATLISSNGSALTRSGFVAKWNIATNRVVWAQQTSGPVEETITGVAVQGTSVYVVGEFKGATATLGSLPLQNNGDPTGYFSEVFVAKLTDSGTSGSVVWAKSAGSAADDAVSGLVVNGTGVYLAGRFNGPTASFGSTVLANADANGFSSDVFVAKLTDSGATSTFNWAQRAGGSGNELVARLASNGTNLYVLGGFNSSSATFGAYTLTKTNAPAASLFITRLTDTGSGRFDWAQQADVDSQPAVAIKGSDIYLAGVFVGTGIFGATSLVSGGGSDIFVAKLTDTGTGAGFAWAQRAGGTGNDRVSAVAVQDRTVYITGYFAGATAAFGTTTLANANASTNDGFVARLIDAGTAPSFTWADRFGSAGYDYGAVLALTGHTVAIAGGSGTPASFGSLVISNTTSANIAFLASLTDPTLTATTTATGSLSFSLSPNPARTAATLTLPALPGTGTATLTLRDALGRTLRTQTVALPAAGLRHPLDLRGLAPGIYAVQVQAGSTAATRRLVVE
ncbi:T9SS type A sorting domain-containing protein [Hymenobacter negativus]|uniref:T9SS type A sorting domain-containing protein n=1 Tax=Hymenobacter negativus TaxID=2795026 RepID=A0ABS0Q7A6_9BACT|nr:T9SS type A sorting domain-containing protein [Hymenobacter negativus]MBH8558546.1 T9SS type A sorting domain-containing protein [Hymenobacter negativus]